MFFVLLITSLALIVSILSGLLIAFIIVIACAMSIQVGFGIRLDWPQILSLTYMIWLLRFYFAVPVRKRKRSK